MNATDFYAIGINYKKSEASIRGMFAISNELHLLLINEAKSLGLASEIMILSTCNRTELYALTNQPHKLTALLCKHTKGGLELFQKISYCKKGKDAISHLFEVGAGLDSQILGDYEIIGQIKKAFKTAKDGGGAAGYLERLVNGAIQASKSIKNQTQLSGGTVSVAFAAIQFIKENMENASDKKILLLGTGKIGRNTCKNIVDYLGNKHITLINRSEEKAIVLAEEMGLQYLGMDKMQEAIATNDIVIVATNAATPIVTPDLLSTKGSKKILIDLSIPNNIDKTCGEMQDIVLVDVDGLSLINDATLQLRQSEVPKAKSIIEEHVAAFLDWLGLRINVPVLKAVKTKLISMQDCELYQSACPMNHFAKMEKPNVSVQKIIDKLALNLKKGNQVGCNYIEAINEYIALSAN